MNIEKGEQLGEPEKIVSSSALQDAINSKLSDNLEEAEKRRAERINNFFNYPFFRGEQSLIDALLENNPNISFDDIKNEGVNLAVVKYCNQMFDFKYCLNKTKSCIKLAFMDEIYDKIISQIGTNSPYDDFQKKFEKKPSSLDCMSYLQNIIYYLESKEPKEGEKPKDGQILGKKTIDILKNITITNNDINNRLKDEEKLHSNIPLSDPKINNDIKKSFDMLLSFEIGKKADRIINLAKDISNQFSNLFWNSIPAINTIIAESSEYRYDEEKFLKDKKNELSSIENNQNIDNNEKKKQKELLRWAYYIDYLKKKNKTIGTTLEQLHKKNFDYDKIDKSVLQSYTKSVADICLKKILKSDIASALKIDCINVDDFSDFYKKLVDLNENYIILDSKRGIKLRVEKTVIPGEHSHLNDLNSYKTKSEYSDAMPISYRIKKSDVDSLNINIEDRIKLLNLLSNVENNDSYIIKGENIGILIYLFYIINSSTPLTTLNPESQKEVENLFGKISNSKDEECKNKNEGGEDGVKNEEGEDKNEESDKQENKDGNKESHKEGEDGAKNREYNTDAPEKKEDTINEFIKEVESFGNGTKFENGSEIWMPIGESELPGGGYKWMKVKINNIDKKRGKFTGRVFGGELKFNSKLEGKPKTFYMNKNDEEWQDLKNLSKDSSKIWLLPDPTKDSFNTFKDKRLNGKLGTGSFKFPDGVNRDGNKFISNIRDNGKEKSIEIKYFGKEGDDKISYKIDYNPSKNSFKVSSSFNGEEEGKNGKSEKKHFSYSRDMDWNNFLIFITQKGLIPQTETESKKASQKQQQEIKMYNKNKLKINRFSINTIKNVVKGKFGEIKKGIDEYNKQQEELLSDILIEDWGLRNLLGNTVGKFSPSLKGTFVSLEQKHYNERDSRARAKIEPYYKQFCADFAFPDTFDQEPPYIKMQGKGSLKDQVLNRVRNAKDIIEGDSEFYQAAGLLLANIEKGGTPYRGLAGYENTGLWIKALMGNAHYENFLKEKQKCIDLYDKEKPKDKRQDALANSEMIYITNNIFGKNSGQIFGSIETPGIPGNLSNSKYIPGPSKRIFSEQFAKKLDDLTKGLFTKDSVINNIPNHNDFDLAEADYYRLIKGARYSEALRNLERMIQLVRTPTQNYKAKKGYLLLMLSGVLDFNGNKGLRKFAYEQGKTRGFAPAMLAKNIGHSEQVALLLDEASNGDFSKNVKLYCRKKDLLNGKTNIELLIGQLNGRLTQEKMDNFDKFIENIPGKNWENRDPALKSLQEDLTNYENQNPNDIILANAALLNFAGLNASADAVSTRLRISEGEFKGKDQDEKKDMGDFWEKCSKKISNMKDDIEKNLDGQEGAKLANQMLDKYLGWFGINGDNKNEVYTWINTANWYKKEIKGSGKNYTQITQKETTVNKEGKTITPKVNMGKLYDKDIEKIIRYGIEGYVRTHRLSSQQLPQQLKNALDTFLDFFLTAFNKGYFDNIKDKINSNEKIFLLGGWDAYEKIAQKNDMTHVSLNDDDTPDSEDFNALPQKQQKSLIRSIFNKDNYRNSDINNMRKALKNHGVSLDEKRDLFNEDSISNEERQEYSTNDQSTKKSNVHTIDFNEKNQQQNHRLAA